MIQSNHKITALVCVYNEEKTVYNVINTILKHPSIQELIVVNDGSDDNTLAVLSKIKSPDHCTFKVYSFSCNKGKGFAMYYGIEKSKGDIIIFIDSDLDGLKLYHITHLIKPLYLNKADMVLGNPGGSFVNYHIDPFKAFTGERALFKKDIMPILFKLSKSKFGAETLINLYYWANEKKVEQVKLEGLTHYNKLEKEPVKEATKDLTIEGRQIITTAFKNLNLFLYGIKNRLK